MPGEAAQHRMRLSVDGYTYRVAPKNRLQLKNPPPLQDEARSGRIPCVGCVAAWPTRTREFDIGKRVRAYGAHPTNQWRSAQNRRHATVLDWACLRLNGKQSLTKPANVIIMLWPIVNSA